MLNSKDKYLKYKKKYLELKSQLGGMQLSVPSTPIAKLIEYNYREYNQEQIKYQKEGNIKNFSKKIPEQSKGSLEKILDMDWNKARTHIFHKNSGKNFQVGRLVPFSNIIKSSEKDIDTIYLSFWLNSFNEIIPDRGMYAQEASNECQIHGPNLGLQTNEVDWNAFKLHYKEQENNLVSNPAPIFDLIICEYIDHNSNQSGPENLKNLQDEYLSLAKEELKDGVNKSDNYWLSDVINLRNSNTNDYKEWYKSILKAIYSKYVKGEVDSTTKFVKMNEIDFKDKYNQKNSEKYNWVKGHLKIECWVTCPEINGKVDLHKVSLYEIKDKSNLYLEIS